MQSKAGSAGEPDVILQVGVEGGYLTLQRRVDDGEDYFRIDVNCSTFADFDPDEFSPGDLHRRGDWVLGFDRALAALDREVPWAGFRPSRVHPDFSERVLAAVRRRLDAEDEVVSSFNYRAWQRACGRAGT